jgi:hypothetical protein
MIEESDIIGRMPSRMMGPCGGKYWEHYAGKRSREETIERKIDIYIHSMPGILGLETTSIHMQFREKPSKIRFLYACGQRLRKHAMPEICRIILNEDGL